MLKLSDVFWAIRLNDHHPDVSPYQVDFVDNMVVVRGVLSGERVVVSKLSSKSKHAIIKNVYVEAHPHCDPDRIEVASSGRTFGQFLLNHESDNQFYKDMVKYKKNQYSGDEFEFGRQFCSGLYVEREELAEIKKELEKGLMIQLVGENEA